MASKKTASVVAKLLPVVLATNITYRRIIAGIQQSAANAELFMIQ
jgi:hypothetical protein